VRSRGVLAAAHCRVIIPTMSAHRLRFHLVRHLLAGSLAVLVGLSTVALVIRAGLVDPRAAFSRPDSPLTPLMLVVMIAVYWGLIWWMRRGPASGNQ
jgi:hypothetical protein